MYLFFPPGSNFPSSIDNTSKNAVSQPTPIYVHIPEIPQNFIRPRQPPPQEPVNERDSSQKSRGSDPLAFSSVQREVLQKKMSETVKSTAAASCPSPVPAVICYDEGIQADFAASARAQVKEKREEKCPAPVAPLGGVNPEIYSHLVSSFELLCREQQGAISDLRSRIGKLEEVKRDFSSPAYQHPQNNFTQSLPRSDEPSAKPAENLREQPREKRLPSKPSPSTLISRLRRDSGSSTGSNHPHEAAKKKQPEKKGKETREKEHEKELPNSEEAANESQEEAEAEEVQEAKARQPKNTKKDVRSASKRVSK